MALALESYEAGLCGGCRGVLAETTDPANEDRYDAEVAALCHRCVALGQVAERYSKHPHPQALLFSATLPSDRGGPGLAREPARHSTTSPSDPEQRIDL